MDTKKTEELTFKDASIELEQIVRELVKDLRGRLDTAEQKVKVLLDESQAGAAITDTTAAPSTAYLDE